LKSPSHGKAVNFYPDDEPVKPVFMQVEEVKLNPNIMDKEETKS